MSVDLGLGLPTRGPGASPAAIAELAQDAERIGLASVWTFERLLRPADCTMVDGTPFPLPESYGCVYDPIDTLAYVAATTSRVRLGTSVVDALFHNPVTLGRRLATVDQLSGGRMVAGLGQGAISQEFVAAGVPPKRRGAGFGEFIEAMRAVWGPDPVNFDGRFYEIPKSEIGPKPVRPSGVPILVGAMAPASVRRAATAGLGLNPIAMNWEMLEGTLQVFREAEKEAGYDSLPVVLCVNGPITDDPIDQDRQPLTGSVEQVAEDLIRLETLGVREAFWSSFWEAAAGEQIRQLERLLTAIS
jgi:probable F420-dependent oxidoreductase